MPYKTHLIMKHIILFSCIALLGIGCSDCDCAVLNGKPNYTVSVEYALVKNDFKIYSQDTALIVYNVVVHPDMMSPTNFRGEYRPKEAAKGIVWYNANTGEEVGPETVADLKKCLLVSKWRNSTVMQPLIDERPQNVELLPDTVPQRVELRPDSLQ